MSKAGEVESSISERPEHHRPRRLADWINPTGARKVHSLIDKVYKRKNLEIAWDRVRANHGAGGIDGESVEAFGEALEERLARLHEELRTEEYTPRAVRQQRIPKAGKPGEWRVLGIPTIYDRVCQQALLNRLEPIFEPIFDDANFGYRRGRSTKDALRKVWKEIEAGGEWIVDADLKDFFGSVVHEKLLTLVAQRVSDGRILRLIEAMLTAGSYGEGLCQLSSLLEEQFLSRRASRLSSFQDTECDGCPTHVLKAPRSGGNMLAHTRSRAQEVPEFVVTAAKPSC
jgi:RNA-directed DNA polymerase